MFRYPFWSLLPILLSGCSIHRVEPRYLAPARLPEEWKTKAERTNYRETDRYDECVAFCRRLANASPFAHYTHFGYSAQGRELPLLILSKNRAFTAEQARRDGKLVVLVESCIHAGECCGKDASLALARDMLIAGERRDLLEHVNLLILPIFNADGHERFGPFNRLNQNGPDEMGWRATAVNLNLNRDFAKADAVEMQAWLRLWNAWNPALFIDIHATNGEDHRYDLFYSASTTALTAQPIATYMEDKLLPPVLTALEADSHLALPYSGPRDERDLSRGIQSWNAATPRYSHGYGSAANRPSLLIEAHAHKPYERRVKASYSMISHVLHELNQAPQELRDVIRRTDRESIEKRGAYGDSGAVVLQIRETEEFDPIVYKTWEYSFRTCEILGGEIAEYSNQPVDIETRLYNRTSVSRAVVPPAAYLVPPEWSEVIHRLDLHGIEYVRLGRPVELEIESCRFQAVTFPAHPFEGRFPPDFTVIPLRESRVFPAATAIVPLNQRRAALAVHLLDPEGPDSLVRWGFFNAVFEYKEYATAEKIEPLAGWMLQNNPELKREFQRRLREDENFANNPGARLDFFYRHSPYWDDRYRVYPVAWLHDERLLEDLRPASIR